VFGPKVKHITTDELAVRLGDGCPVLIDVREPHEFADGHVPGAVNIPLGGLKAATANMDPARETLLICRSGSRSLNAARTLIKAGFKDVHNVRGGTQAWRGRLER